MQKVIWVALLLGVGLFSGCAKKPGEKFEKGVIEHRSYNIRFWGYRRAVKVKADPQAVDAYLRDPGHLVSASKSLNIKMEGSSLAEKRGDQVIFRTQHMGVPITMNLVLWDRVPAQEVLFIFLMNDTLMGFLRYRLRPIPEGTRFDFELEIEETNPLLESLIQTLGVDDMLMKLQDDDVEMMLKHFDPEYQPEKSREFLGENFDKLYQARQVSIWINASSRKVANYLASPAFTELVRQNYDIDFGQAFTSRNPGIYPLKVNFLGNATTPDALVMSYEFGEHIFAYWAGKINARIQIFVTPKSSGSEMTLAYMLESPSSFTVEIANILANTAQIPKAVEQVMIEIKNDIEGES